MIIEVQDLGDAQPAVKEDIRFFQSAGCYQLGTGLAMAIGVGSGRIDGKSFKMNILDRADRKAAPPQFAGDLLDNSGLTRPGYSDDRKNFDRQSPHQKVGAAATQPALNQRHHCVITAAQVQFVQVAAPGKGAKGPRFHGDSRFLRL